jgi:hypothetical protein
MEVSKLEIMKYRFISLIIVIIGISLLIFDIDIIGYPIIALGLYFLFAPHKVTKSNGNHSSKQTSVKKEFYINKLVNAYKIVYSCGDMEAIECLRRNYTEIELKDILNRIKKAKKYESLDSVLINNPPFKEDTEIVSYYDNLHNGN